MSVQELSIRLSPPLSHPMHAYIVCLPLEGISAISLVACRPRIVLFTVSVVSISIIATMSGENKSKSDSRAFPA